MVEAPDGEGHIAAGVGEADLQLREPVEHAAEDQRGGGDGRLQRVADEVHQVVAGERLADAVVEGVQQDEGAKRLRCLENREERRVVPVHAVDVRGDDHALQLQDSHRPLELAHGGAGILQRQGGDAEEAVGSLGDRLGDLLVHRLRAGDRDVSASRWSRKNCGLSDITWMSISSSSIVRMRSRCGCQYSGMALSVALREPVCRPVCRRRCA